MSFSLCAMIWFSVKNNMVVKESLPGSIRFILLNCLGGQSYLRNVKKKREESLANMDIRRENKKANLISNKSCGGRNDHSVIENKGMNFI